MRDAAQGLSAKRALANRPVQRRFAVAPALIRTPMRTTAVLATMSARVVSQSAGEDNAGVLLERRSALTLAALTRTQTISIAEDAETHAQQASPATGDNASAAALVDLRRDKFVRAARNARVVVARRERGASSSPAPT